MLTRFLRISVLVGVCAFAASIALARQVTLDTAIADIRAGDPLRGLATLNEIAKQSPSSPQIAIVHAYRALAYARMDQRDRARTAAAQALQADPKLVIGPPDFTPDIISLFDGLRTFAPADLAVAAEPPKPAATPAPAPVAAAPAPPPAAAPSPTGRGTIVIYRPSAFVGGARRMKIECNGVKVADLQNGRIVTLKANAGSHNLKVQGKEATVDVVPGGEYFLRAGPGAMGVSLKVVPNGEAAAEMKERKVKPNDADRIYSEECKP